MTIVELLKNATKIINRSVLQENEKEELKNILCYLSEWKKNNPIKDGMYPQIDFVLYNASRKLRTFGYNKLNKFTNETINKDDDLSQFRDCIIDEYYKTESGFVLDKAQKEILDDFEEHNQKLFLSAPTSFGKTFLLKEIIYRHKDEYENIVIVLPTVALLMEVTDELEALNNTHQLGYSLFNSIYKDIDISERNIFVLTPERVIRLLAIIPDIKIDFFFFDEIYKIDEDISIKTEDDTGEKIEIGIESTEGQSNGEHRAVAFRLSLYFLLKRCPACYLAGPFIALSDLRPGFQNMLKRHNIYPKEITFIPTLKNQIDFHGKTYKFHSEFDSEEKPSGASNQIEKLVFATKELSISKDNQAIIYCIYPAYTEKNARAFCDAVGANKTDDISLMDFINHLRNSYSFEYNGNKSIDHWDFVYALEHEIGIHNGKFPKYFQREIMQLFNNCKMDTLFCTSTIVEGVNTNAKTVVLFSNPSGKTQEGKKFLLLNINGRAGRYQHHFVGNVVYLKNESIKLVDAAGISLDFKPYNGQVSLNDLDLENIADNDLSSANLAKKNRLSFDRVLLPDSVFVENRLIERKKQESILNSILSNISLFYGIEDTTVLQFVENGYFESILSIWAEIGEIKKTQVEAIKWFAINYAKNSYQGVLEYEFNRYHTENDDPHKFANDAYRKVFRNVKDTIEYQLPRIISLFESLLNRAFEIKNIQLSEPIDFSRVIRYFEIGASTLLGTDMIEKGVPVVTVKKIENMRFNSDELMEQRVQLKNHFSARAYMFDSYEKQKVSFYITKYCK